MITLFACNSPSVKAHSSVVCGPRSLVIPKPLKRRTVSYSTVVLYIRIMKVLGFWPEIITPNQLNIYFLTLWEHWLGLAKPKNVFRLILNPSIK